MNDSKRRSLRLFFTGFTMGIADLIPGVSGGTIAFLFGIYDELLYSIKVVTGDVPKLFLTGRFVEAFRLIPFSFLVPLGGGILLAILGLARAVSLLLDTQPVAVWAFFFGLVLASTLVVARRVTHWNLHRVLLCIVGFVFTFIIVGLPALSGNDSLLAVFATGVIAITAMILPGISGSLIMALLGQYEIIVGAVADFDVSIMLVFFAGAMTGLAIFVRILGWLLRHFYFSVIALLAGVMAGSLRRIWPWQISEAEGSVSNILPALDASLVWMLLLIAFGIATVLLLERVGIATEHDDIDSPEFQKELPPKE